MKRTVWPLMGALLALTSCQPSDRDIRVVWSGEFLVIDYPWSIWRLVGLQDRTYCILEIELFDASKVLWRQKLRQNEGEWASCADVRMPIKLNTSLKGFDIDHRPRDFDAGAFPKLVSGVRYSIGINGIGDGRVDFVMSEPGGDLVNITDRDKVMRGPCGSWWGKASCYRREP